jgi:tetratricopeptide (TPR) repeat protein
MKDADACFKEGMKHIGLSWHADYHSEVVGDLEAAIGEFDRALALQPDHAEAWIQKGIALARLGQHEKAATALAEAIRLRPDDPELWLQRAGSLHGLQRHAEALAACDEALHRRPDDGEALFLRAETLDALGRDAHALSAWDEVLRRGDCRTINLHSRTMRVVTTDFRRLRARLARAANLARLGQRGEAVVAYRGLIEENVDREAAQPFQASLRTLEAARSAYHAYIEEHANDPMTLKCAGNAFLCARRTSEALELYETATRLDPGDADAWLGKAAALVQAGRRAESIPAYRESLRLKPGYLASSLRLDVVLKELAMAETDAKSGKWKVIGRDTFAREDFVAGEFPSERAAREWVQAREAANEKTQDEGLRDEYWVVPPQ